MTEKSGVLLGGEASNLGATPDEESELDKQRAQIEQELRRREQRVLEISAAADSIKMDLHGARRLSATCCGDGLALMAADSRRKKLRLRLKELLVEHEQARADVVRAQERLAELEKEDQEKTSA